MMEFGEEMYMRLNKLPQASFAFRKKQNHICFKNWETWIFWETDFVTVQIKSWSVAEEKLYLA